MKRLLLQHQIKDEVSAVSCPYTYTYIYISIQLPASTTSTTTAVAANISEIRGNIYWQPDRRCNLSSLTRLIAPSHAEDGRPSFLSPSTLTSGVSLTLVSCYHMQLARHMAGVDDG